MNEKNAFLVCKTTRCLALKQRHQRIMVTLARLVTTTPYRFEFTAIEDVVYFHIHMMGMEGVNRSQSRIGPRIPQILATDGSVSKGTRGVIHVAHDQNVIRRLIQQFAHGLGLSRMGDKSVPQFARHRLDATLSIGWDIHGFYYLTIVTCEAQ